MAGASVEDEALQAVGGYLFLTRAVAVAVAPAPAPALALALALALASLRLTQVQELSALQSLRAHFEAVRQLVEAMHEDVETTAQNCQTMDGMLSRGKSQAQHERWRIWTLTCS